MNALSVSGLTCGIPKPIKNYASCVNLIGGLHFSDERFLTLSGFRVSYKSSNGDAMCIFAKNQDSVEVRFDGNGGWSVSKIWKTMGKTTTRPYHVYQPPQRDRILPWVCFLVPKAA